MLHLGKSKLLGYVSLAHRRTGVGANAIGWSQVDLHLRDEKVPDSIQNEILRRELRGIPVSK